MNFQEFDYELNNQINILQKRSKDVILTGLITMLGIMFVNAELAYEYDWSLWIDIPCATVVAMGAMVPFVLWSQKLSEQASSLEQQTAYVVNLGDRLDMGITRYTSYNNICSNAVGVGLKVSF